MLARVVTCDAREAVARAHAALSAASDGGCHLVGSIVQGPVAVLGSRQRASAVIEGADAVHRLTTGIEAWIGDRAIWWSLALPTLSALYPDARAETLLNRNVRPFLKGLTRCGALAHYFGREVISIQRRSGAVLGYDVLADGRVLLDVIAGWNGPTSLPRERSSARRRETPRAEGLALEPLVSGRSAAEVAAAVMDAVERVGAVPWAATPASAELLNIEANDEVQTLASKRVPIGWIDAGLRGAAPWIGGDLLASTAWLARVEAAFAADDELPAGAVLHGALPGDLAALWREAIP